MIYVCAGMSRSGSTWLFNAVRLLLKHAGAPDIAGGYMGQIDELITHRTAIIKLHPYYAEVAAKAEVILTSHRDLRDVVASMHRHYQMDFSTTFVNNCVRDHVRWSQIAAYDLHYEQLLVDKLSEVKKIAAVLKLPRQTFDQLPYEAILSEIEGEKFGRQFSKSTEYDAVNLLHKGHVTDGRHGSWKSVVPEEFIVAIEKEFGGWMTINGYLDSPVEAGR